MVGVGRPGALGDVEVAVHRVSGVDQQHGVVLTRLGYPFDVEVDDARYVDAPDPALGLELDGHLFYASEIGGHGSPSLGGAAHLTGEDLLHGFPLPGGGLFVDIESRGPVAVAHGSGGVIRRQEIQPAQLDSVEIAFLDVKSQTNVAVPIGGLN